MTEEEMARIYVCPDFESPEDFRAAVITGMAIEPCAIKLTHITTSGTMTVVGPHQPALPQWAASVQVERGLIVRVMSVVRIGNPHVAFDPTQDEEYPWLVIENGGVSDRYATETAAKDAVSRARV